MPRRISTNAIIRWIRIKLNQIPSPDANALYGRFYLLATGQHGTRLSDGSDWLAAKSDHTHANELPTYGAGEANKFLQVNPAGNALEWDTAAGITDHGMLTGLLDDDHPQYHTDARGDLRYAPIANSHVAATVTDSSEIDFTLTGQQITADLKTTAVTAGSYVLSSITVDSKGRITSASNGYAERSIVSVSGSKTLALTDRGTKQMCSSASAITITVPPNSSVAFPTGTEIDVFRNGAGTVTMVAGSGVTIRTAGALAITAQWRAAHLTKIATDEWILIGAV